LFLLSLTLPEPPTEMDNAAGTPKD